MSGGLMHLVAYGEENNMVIRNNTYDIVELLFNHNTVSIEKNGDVGKLQHLIL